MPRCAAGACPAATHCVASGDDGGAAWPDGGADSGEDGLCVPDGGDCDCNEANVGLTVPCVLRASGGAECAGVRMCGEGGFAACEPALGEQCNGADDDCDGEVDEDFKNEAGVYATAEHCGACASPCAAPGPNMVATCDVLGVTASCEVTCEDGFVDVDGIPASGCECERWDGMGPPPVVGGDTDCDGVVDDATDFVYVTTTGSDSNAGSLAKPMRTVPAAIARAASLGRDVLVAAGVYDGKIALTAGVSVFGGYRQDFRDRDVALYPVVLERSDGAPGEPVIVCTNIQATTRIEGVTVVGSDAVAEGEGSSAVFADGCGSGVTFASIELYAGAGADGRRGADSSENLAGWGLSTLGELDGADGTSGRAPTIDGCPPLAGGSAGAHTCPQAGNVGGGAGGQATCPGAICTF
ncbi:MAG: hypothetical protein KC417_16805, partial [Myxococcales bacterium]|nr:hypothetical protein [Myxococcales bacterium]